jgi:hypothetical protein
LNYLPALSVGLLFDNQNYLASFSRGLFVVAAWRLRDSHVTVINNYYSSTAGCAARMHSQSATHPETDRLPDVKLDLVTVTVTVRDVDSDQETLGAPDSQDGDPQRAASDKIVDIAPRVQSVSKSENKWAAAFKRLSPEDRERFGPAKTEHHNARDVLVGILEATKQKKDECMDKRWKIVIKGRPIILRDVVEKISVWVSKVLVCTSQFVCCQHVINVI